jgi:hypothetical protein
MTWKNGKPTPSKTRLVWNWPEIWATIGVSASLVLIITAMFYGYSLGG